MRLRLLACAALGALVAATPANAVVIDFESTPAGGYSNLVFGDVTITAPGGTFSITNGPNGTKGLLPEGSPRPLVRLDFAALASSVSVELGDFNQDADEAYLELFTSGDVSLGIVTLPIASPDQTMHLLSLTPASGAAYALLGGRAPAVNGSSLYVDNIDVAFDLVAVPEPATWGMMMAGFGLAGGALRGRRRVKTAFA